MDEIGQVESSSNKAPFFPIFLSRTLGFGNCTSQGRSWVIRLVCALQQLADILKRTSHKSSSQRNTNSACVRLHTCVLCCSDNLYRPVHHFERELKSCLLHCSSVKHSIQVAQYLHISFPLRIPSSACPCPTLPFLFGIIPGPPSLV